MNALVKAVQNAKLHIANLVLSNDDKEARKRSLMKLGKPELVEIILSKEKFDSLKIEDLVKPILEDPECAWLDYATIAEMVKEAVPSANTSSKSLASYASKYPKAKGWAVVPRKNAAEKQAEMMRLLEL